MLEIKGTQDIFSLDVDLANPLANSLLKSMRSPIEKIVGLDLMNDIYRRSCQMEDISRFAENILKVMNVDFRISEQDLARIPLNGKIVVVANHPFGGIEGIIMAAILQRVRPDVKIMANYLLSAIPEMRDLFIFVDPFGGASAARANLASMKNTISWLRDGKMLGVFPAGEVAHFTLKNRKIADPVWSNTIAKIVKKTETPVLPMFFIGRNRLMFQLAGMLHPRLRTAMLPRELANKKNTVIEVRVGNVIPFTRLRKFEDETDLTDYIRQRTFMLENRPASEDPGKAITFPGTATMVPVIEAVDPELLLQDVEALPAEQLLLQTADTKVFYANYEQIPNIITEIGRLREITFRATDEGTGRAVDLDEFDEYYQHLFVWNIQKLEIVGAYRLGRTDKIIERFGQKGMYTTTLFNIKPAFFQQISPALEMGRSFVRIEYQRSFSPLLMLWRGIGHYVALHPRYKILFGPVSINKEYQSSSRQLMVKFLKVHNYMPELANKVKAITPFRAERIKGWDRKHTKRIINSIDDVSMVVSDLEPDDKGVPILLKQYLKLGGKLLGFNVDPNFSDVLDGLILVDITKTDPKIMERYMPKQKLVEFHVMHRSSFAAELSEAAKPSKAEAEA
jgi:putative hemolysin